MPPIGRYLRFHGPRALEHACHGAYTGRRLWRTADRLRESIAQGIGIFAYLNHDFEGHAVKDWLCLRQRVAGY